MAYSRSSRRADAKLEAGAKLVLFAILGLALAVGGLSHFGDALKGILLLVVMIAMVGVAALLISKSRLMTSKKLGLFLALGALVTAFLWNALRAPRQWVEDRATVTAIKEGTATLRLGVTILGPIANVATPPAAQWKVGASVPIWIDPVSRNQFALEPRATIGGLRYGMLWSASALLGGALWLLWRGSRWIDPNLPARPEFAFALPRRGVPAPLVAPRAVAPPSTISRLRLIDWFQFETVCARILESEGWTVKRRGGANPDGGADHLALKGARKMVVQCKHWQNWRVKPDKIRELMGTRGSAEFMADDAVLFTLSECTEAALAVANANAINIRNTNAIAKAIDSIGIERFPELLNPDIKLCPKCGAPMILRKTATPFWGCSTYPRCRGKIEA